MLPAQAPEVMMEGRISKAADVYAFGERGREGGEGAGAAIARIACALAAQE